MAVELRYKVLLVIGVFAGIAGMLAVLFDTNSGLNSNNDNVFKRRHVPVCHLYCWLLVGVVLSCLSPVAFSPNHGCIWFVVACCPPPSVLGLSACF